MKMVPATLRTSVLATLATVAFALTLMSHHNAIALSSSPAPPIKQTPPCGDVTTSVELPVKYEVYPWAVAASYPR